MAERTEKRFNGLMWWIDRWRKSTAFTDMTLEQQGAYRNLLDEATLRGGALPDDDRILAKACGDATAWKRLRPVVMDRFVRNEDGWHHETLDEVLAQSVKRSEKQHRYRNKKGNGGGNAGGNDDGSPGLQFEVTEDVTEVVYQDLDLRTDESKNDSSGPIPGDLLGVHHRLFVARYGRKPAYDGKKDASIAKRLLKAHGLDGATRMVEAFFQTSDAWIVDKGHSFGLLAMAGVQNKLSAEMSRRRPGVHPSPVSDAEETHRKIAEMNARPVGQLPWKKAGA